MRLNVLSVLQVIQHHITCNIYLDKYVELIDSNKNTQAISKKTNKHHIIPAYYFRHFDLPVDKSLLE